MKRFCHRTLITATLLAAALAVGLGGCEAQFRNAAAPAYKMEPGRAPLAPDSIEPRSAIVPPSSLPARDEEIWVIARPPAQEPRVAPQADDDTPGSGAMVTRLPDQQQTVPLPLKHTDVKATVTGYIASVEVTQQFQNPFAVKIEAQYVFPLPQNAAVSGFVMTIGDRRIRGIIRQRQEAEAIYHEARRQGYTAALLTQERANIFTQRVANIAPGKAIDVNIRYFNTLSYADGWYEFVFPMVVGPRFNPPSVGDEGVGAVPRDRGGALGQKIQVPYLRPGERSGHDIALSVDLDAGVAIEALACNTHAIDHTSASPQRHTVALARGDRIPNKDFVLRWRVAGETLKTGLIVQRPTNAQDDGGYFAFMLYPPADLNRLHRQPMEMIFVLDCSGSMKGQPLAKAKEAIRRALHRLEPGDTFQIIRFSNDASQLGAAPLPATAYNVQRGLDYVRSLDGGGGTMMIEGIKAALSFPHDRQRLRVVAFLTDGYIGNEKQILDELHRRLGPTRVFSFGVGSSPNRYLMDRMAKLGRGAVAYVGLNDDAGQIMDLYFDRVSHPAMTDVSIEWGNAQVFSVFPRQLPDVFVGRPIVVTGRYRGQPPAPGNVIVRGRAGGEAIDLAVSMVPDPRGDDAPAAGGDVGDDGGTGVGAVAAVWARAQIADLVDQATFTDDAQGELPDEIKRVALRYGLMSAYTAFVAVDSKTRTSGDHGVTVGVPVPAPKGVRYETTVPE